MLKKNVKAILMATLLSLSLLGTAACMKGGDKTSTDDTAITYPIIMPDGKTLMNGFEYFDRDIQIIRLFNEFGRLDENEDKKFVRSGEKSLKITPLGARMTTANPFFLLPTYSIRFDEVAFGDFSKVDTISFWFYNNEETDVNVGIGFGTGTLKMADRRDVINKTNVEYFTLQNGWNYVEYNVEPAHLALQGLNIKEVYGIVVEFDYVQSHKLADSPEVYMDDVCLSYLEEEKNATFTMDVKKGTTTEGKEYWSISDFENPLETYYYYYQYSYPAPAAGHPVIKPVYAGDYDVIAASGTQALLIQKKHGGGVYGWPTIRIHEKVMQAVFAAIGDDIKEHPENYAFKFDLYNAATVNNGFSLEFDGAATWSTISVAPGQWGTFEKTFASINGAATNATKVYTDTQGSIRFSWGSYYGEENIDDRPLLLDNVRIEKIA